MAAHVMQYPDQSSVLQMKVLENVRILSGAENKFVGESVILNCLSSFGINAEATRMACASLVQGNRMECFVPLTTNLCGGCGCGTDCCGGCGGGCCGCGRYYRVKIG